MLLLLLSSSVGFENLCVCPTARFTRAHELTGDMILFSVQYHADGKSVYSLEVLLFFYLGDVILKVDGKSVYGLTEAQIVQMVVGPPQSKVTITVQSQFGYPYVVTAPFQELPFDLERDKKNKKKQKKKSSPDDDGTVCQY